MEYQIVFKKSFAASLLKVCLHLEEHWGIGVAAEFYNSVFRKIEQIEANPEIGSPSSKLKNIRTLHITKHNRLYYKVVGTKIIIQNLYDTRRKNYHP